MTQKVASMTQKMTSMTQKVTSMIQEVTSMTQKSYINDTGKSQSATQRNFCVNPMTKKCPKNLIEKFCHKEVSSGGL